MPWSTSKSHLIIAEKIKHDLLKSAWTICANNFPFLESSGPIDILSLKYPEENNYGKPSIFVVGVLSVP